MVHFIAMTLMNLLHNFLYFYFIILNYFLKIYHSPSKMFTFWMWIWSYNSPTNSLFLTFFSNYCNFSNFWYWNCFNFTYNCYIQKCKLYYLMKNLSIFYYYIINWTLSWMKSKYIKLNYL
uniref:NADH dehydrogenase subunit 3 n=1 Tax=Coenonympha phryne TaxID=554498 RepID=A0A067YT14_9NEOP|nr:NADH dehydrogenase subunit 3 [Triphysa phryne]AHH92996.1 NADH dehydrogenase subunit 3 [Triphysa phryne]